MGGEFTRQTVYWGQESSTKAIPWGRRGRKGFKMRSKPARSQGGAGVVVLLICPQGHHACNKIYVQVRDPSSARGPEGSELPPGRRKPVASLATRPGWSHMRGAKESIPAVVFNHMVEFNDVLPFFVLLAALKSLLLKRGESPSPLQELYLKGLTKPWRENLTGPILHMMKLWSRKIKLPAHRHRSGKYQGCASH